MLELAWDGDWYRRAYFDDGTPLGSVQNEECKLDSHHAVVGGDLGGGAAAPRRAGHERRARAPGAARRAGSSCCSRRPSTACRTTPGYIKGYLPGVRENGGQYTHAAIWAVIALARLGMGDEAMELFHLINPINHMRTAEDVERYRAEPYVVAGDVYAHPMHVGRGGWTWYTGSAGWMYQARGAGDAGAEAKRQHDQHRPVHPDGVAGVHARVDGSEARATASSSRTPSTGPAASSRRSSMATPVDPAAIPLVGRRRARGAGRAGRRGGARPDE